MNARVEVPERLLWKVLAVSFTAHVALLAAWPQARVTRAPHAPRAELAFIDVPARPAPVVPPPPPVVQRVAAPRARASAPATAPAAPTPPESATKMDLADAPSAVVLPTFTLPPQSTGPVRVGPPSGPSSTGSDRPGAEALDGTSASLAAEVRVPYPEAARERGIEGSVRLRVTVDASGAVQDVVVLSGPGFGLDEAARKALARFRFKPALRGGQPVESTFVYTYTFELD